MIFDAGHAVATQRALAQELGRPPTVSELARAVAIDEEQVIEALRAQSGRSALSLQEPTRTTR